MRRTYSFEEELEGLIHMAMDGSPVGPRLAESLRLAARTACMKHGLGRAQIRILRAGNGMVVEIIPPPGAPRVQTIRVNVG
jgi:hypothetical protein